MKASYCLPTFGLALAMMTSSCGLLPIYIDLAEPASSSTVSIVKNVAPTAPHLSFAHPTGPGANSMIGRVGAGSSGTVKLIVRNDPTLWLAMALVTSLKNAGYHVETTESIDTAQTPIAVTLHVAEVYAFYYGGDGTYSEVKARIVAEVKIYDRGQLKLHRTYSGAYSNPPPTLTWPQDAIQQTMEHALTNFLNQALPDLTAFLAHAT
jgi:hypothetical protein